jgi:hypothetical protein
MKAVCAISKMISEEKYDSLKPLVTENTIKLFKRRMPLLNVEQKKLITVNGQDIFDQCPYLFEKTYDRPSGRVFVKIGVLYLVLPGFRMEKMFQSKPGNSPKEIHEIKEFFARNTIYVDYRFVLSYLFGNLLSYYIILTC